MNKVLYIVPLLDVDINKGVRCIRTALNALNSNNFFIHFIVIVQTVNSTCDISSLKMSENIEVIVTSDIGTSVSRNLGIDYAIDLGYNYIGFLDAGILISRSFGYALTIFLTKNSEQIFCGALNWVDSDKFNKINDDKPNDTENLKFSRKYSSHALRPLKDTYIGCFLFPVYMIREFRFNLDLGPGKGNVLNSGEDVDILFRMFGSNNLCITYCNSAYLFHEKRYGSGKRLQYAVGQGALYGFYVKQAFTNKTYLLAIRIHILFFFVLFCVNTVMVCAFNGKVGRVIFKRRVFGFFNKKYQLFYEVKS
jgi:hypothetical protein